MTVHAPNILYVITDLELGGVPLHLYRLAGAMRARGFRITAVSLAPPGPVSQLLGNAGFDVRSCNGRGGWDFRVVPRLAALIREITPDIVHTFLFHANLAGRFAAASADFPWQRLIGEIQTVEVERKWHLWVDRCTYDGCRLILGNSPSVIEHLAAQARVPREKLRLVRGGVDPTPIRAAEPIDQSVLGLQNGSVMILWVGRLDPVKGLLFLLDAFATLKTRDDVHLVLAGNGPMRRKIMDRANGLSLTSRVHILGSRRDVPNLLKAADLFVFPSRTEGLPNALLEAMAAGRPIVATDAPGCRDLIEHERTGLLVPYGDTASLAGAMSHLLTDRNLALRLGDAASAEVDSRWHAAAMYNAYAEVYHEILSGR